MLTLKINPIPSSIYPTKLTVHYGSHTSLGGSVPAAPRLIFCLPTPRLVHQASLDLQLQKALPPHLNRPPNKARAIKMFCLRARAVPSTFRATTSAMRTPMNRYAKQPTTFPALKPTR